MKNLIHKSDYDQIVSRIRRLSANSQHVWGKMTVNEMICHVSDPFRDVLGIRNTEPVLPEEMRLQIIPMVLNEMPFDRNLQTFPPYLQGQDGGGTKPTSFEADKKVLLGMVEKFYATDNHAKFQPHAGLGVLSKEQLGIYFWKHLDHHLQQFGV